jgi:hypothetical protein
LSESQIVLTPAIAELERLYLSYPQIVAPLAHQAVKRGILLIVGYMRTEGYPPETAANKPGRTKIIPGALYKDGRDRVVPLGYYERGRGAWYPIVRREHLPEKLGKGVGAIRARKHSAGRVIGYKLAGGGTSQRLGASWTTSTSNTEGGGIVGIVGTNTTYADWVQGPNQARIHQENGWITLSRAIDEAMPDITAAFAEALDESLRIVAQKGSA